MTYQQPRKQSGALHLVDGVDEDAEFLEFVESVTVSRAELAAMVDGKQPYDGSRNAPVSGEAGRRFKQDRYPALKEVVIRFGRGWHKLATAFAWTIGPSFQHRGSRKV